MAETKKTDNHDPSKKLALRRHFMAKYHADGKARVCDCCMGSGLLWSTLRKDFILESYIGLDVKPKKGRLQVDSARYLDAGGWTHNVVDVDTYGSPWKHWVAIFQNCKTDVTVFLTIGMVKVMGGGQMMTEAKAALGIDKLKSLPVSIAGKLDKMATTYMLAEPLKHGFEIAECMEAEHFGSARYIGVRLIRKNIS